MKLAERLNKVNRTKFLNLKKMVGINEDKLSKIVSANKQDMYLKSTGVLLTKI